MARILLTHPHEALVKYYGDKALCGLQKLADVRLNEVGREWNLDELIEAAQGCDVIVSYRQTAAPAALFQALPDLVSFSRCAVDIRNVDVAAASGLGILVTHTGPGFMASVSEWIMGVMIDLSRQISALSQSFRSGVSPTPMMGRELRGSTLGVIGYGQIGRYVCGLARAFGMEILVSDPHVSVDDAGVRQVGLPELLERSDYVVCLAVATGETENLMDSSSFSHMKSTAFFINASRGNLVDEAALLGALDMGRIAGCAIDVGRAPDQLPSPLLARHPKVIATPHMAGLTPPAVEFQALQTVKQVGVILSGLAPEGAVNAAQATRLSWLVAGGGL
ncbi:MAG: hydroxyacid dehydrogenase [Castellaniella sp.]|uniref:NAD(P)-dependent oxidoreductase n=1 Tax=Castellaniella sp. TaxID=1955812 RepID=UPI0012237B5E|nr:NAD(P)-dependent oxidoreductase [Castellaniella sp.]TAN27744.1 MAG: hydroxyacid dehydrogenase [Castellaniella sp.]